MNPPRRRFLLLAAVLAGIGGLALPAPARESHAGSVRVLDPWTRATGGAGAAVGFLTITNDGRSAARLTGAACPVAAHTTIQDADNAPLGGVDIAPGGTVKLTPGGVHLVLAGTRHRLVRGDTISCRLAFRGAGTLDVALLIRGAHAVEPLMGPIGSE